MARGESLIRQWNLLKTLQNRRFGIDLDELAERLECSRRQISRDLRVLEDAGFPIESEARDFGKKYWKLRQGFIEREDLRLTTTELIGLFLGRKLLEPLSGTQIGDGLKTLLRKIKSLLPEKALDYFADLDETFFVRSVVHANHQGQDMVIGVLNRAIADQHAVRVRYQSAHTGRCIDSEYHPYGMVIFGTNLYCIGRLMECGEVRTLKVSRFESAEPAGGRFERPADFSLPSHFDAAFGIICSERSRRVIVRFSGWAATNVREHRWHPSQTIIEDLGESLVAQFDIGDSAEFIRWLLGYGRHAAVLKPASLAHKVRQELAGALDHYGPLGSVALTGRAEKSEKIK